jgi:hypothetical protein
MVAEPALHDGTFSSLRVDLDRHFSMSKFNERITNGDNVVLLKLPVA